MNLQLIQGNFDAKDALEIITQMVSIKIRFHENKITNSENEEDIKYRESKIKKLQNDLYGMRNFLLSNGNNINIEGEINLFN